MAARTWFADFLKVPLAEVSGAPPPVHAPWKSPLDRATYPRGRSVRLTADYEAWLSASVADLAARYGNAYLDAAELDDPRARRFLASARVLAATGAALIAGDLAALEELGSRARAPGPVRVPTRLHLTHRGTTCEPPFVIGGRDIAKSSMQDAEALLQFFVSRIRASACLLDGEPRTAKRIGAHLAAEFAGCANILTPLARATVDAAATRALSAQFARLLHECKRHSWSRDMPEEELKAAFLEDEKDYERVAPRFAQAALAACGYTPKEARNLFEYRRKRRERMNDASPTASPAMSKLAPKPSTLPADAARSSSSAKASATRRT